jgi:hypothetical protein
MMRYWLKTAVAFVVAVACGLLAAEAIVSRVMPQPRGTFTRMLSPSDTYYVNVPNSVSSQTLGDRTVHYRINNLGMRGGPYDPMVPSVLVLGDSFTFGLFREEDESLPVRLQSLADQEIGPHKLQILNGAVGGWGLAEQLAFLQDYGARTHPLVVVSMLNYTSISRAYNSDLFIFDYPTTTRLVRRHTPNLSNPWIGPDRFGQSNSSMAWRWLYDHSELAVLIRRVHDQTIDWLHRSRGDNNEGLPFAAPDVNKAEVAALTRAVISQLSETSRALGAGFMLVDNGFAWQADPKIQSTSIDAPGLAAVPAIVGDLGIVYVDPTSVISAARYTTPMDIPGDAHPTVAANALLAAQIWPVLRQQLGAIKAGPRT